MTAPDASTSPVEGAFLMKRWRVSVDGYGTGAYDATSRGKALSDAWRSDAFAHLSFKQFLGVARCQQEVDLPARYGDPITVAGHLGFFIENNRQYVRFAVPGGDGVLCAHPYEVLPVEYRPDTYRDRDAEVSHVG